MKEEGPTLEELEKESVPVIETEGKDEVPTEEMKEEGPTKEEERKLEEIKEEIKEKALEGILEELDGKRKNYIEADKKYKIAKKKEKTGLSLAEIKLEEAGLEYEKIKTEYGRRLYREKLELLRREGIAEDHPRFNEEMSLLKASLFEDLIIREQDLLAKAKVDSLESRTRGAFEKMIINYARLPMWKKVLISTGVVTGAALAGGVVGGTTAALVFGTTRFARGMVAGKLAALSGTLVKSVGTRKVNEWNQKEVAGLRENFGLDIAPEIEKEGDSFRDMMKKMTEDYEEIVKKTNRKHRNVTLWSAGVGVVVGGTAALTSGHLDGVGADIISQKLGLADVAAAKVSAVEASSYDIPIPTEASPEAHSGVSVELPMEEPMTTLEIGDRGPEGAIIDFLRNNPDAAKESFGWDGEANLDRWAGIKAHQLWLEDAGEQLKDPATIEQLRELGYSQDLKGFAEMMRRIGEGDVEINQDGTIDLRNMDYLGARIPTEAPSVETSLPSEEMIRPTIVAPEGTTRIPYAEGELIVNRDDNDISFSLDGKEFAEGTIHDDGTYYIPQTEGSLDSTFIKAYNAARFNLEALGKGEEMRSGLGEIKDFPFLEKEVPEKLLMTEMKGVNLETKSLLNDLIYKTPLDTETKVLRLAELVKSGRIKTEDFARYYVQMTGGEAERISPTFLDNLKNNFEKVAKFQGKTFEVGESKNTLNSVTALEIILRRLLKARAV